MKKLLSTLVIATVFFVSNAQDFEIIFAGRGASSSVDSVLVENLTQGTSLKLAGLDTLYLTKTTTGINLFKKGSDLIVYPNPFLSYCNIQFSTQKSEKITVQLFDISGRKTTSKVEFIEPGIHNFQINGIPRGMYIVQVRSTSLFQTAKILSYNRNSGNPEIKYEGFNALLKPELVKKSAADTIQNITYNTNDNLLFSATPGDDVFDEDGTFLLVRGVTMTEEPEIEENAPFIFEFTPCTDPDGRNYSGTKIGNQFWMSENYAYKIESGSWVYDNDESKLQKYGRLYTWEAARNNAPEGWHLPTEGDWTELIDYAKQLINEADIGTALKNYSGWLPVNDNVTGNGTNSSGFAALPGGSRFFVNGTFYKSGEAGYWWIDKNYSDSNALIKKLTNGNTELEFGNSNKGYGFSVRYIRNNIPLVTTLNASEITGNSASMNGSIDNDGGYPITEAGIYWSKTNQNPEANDNVATVECQGGLFGIYNTNIELDSTYYYKAFATNEVGTSVGGVVSFTANQ